MVVEVLGVLRGVGNASGWPGSGHNVVEQKVEPGAQQGRRTVRLIVRESLDAILGFCWLS